MRAIGAMGDETDIPKLREIQEKETGMVSAAGRGFGLIPAISLSRAAETTIEKIPLDCGDDTNWLGEEPLRGRLSVFLKAF